MIFMSKYKREMDRISVTEEMEERILNNIRKAEFSAPKKSFKWMGFAAAAAVCCLAVTVGISYQSFEGRISTSEPTDAVPETVGSTVRISPPSEPDGTVGGNGVPTMNTPTEDDVVIVATEQETAVPAVTPDPEECHVPATEHIPDETVIGKPETKIPDTVPPDVVPGLGGDTVDETAPPAGDVQIPNPINNWETLDELKANLSFAPKLPTTAFVEELGYRSIMGMAEITYVDSDANGDEVLNNITYRTAQGTDDISGDYNSYSEVKTVTVNGMEVTLKSDSNSCVMLAVWTDGEYSYSLSFEHGASYERVTEIIESIK